MSLRVPSHYHFVFGLRPQTEPFHLMYYLCLASCLEVNRPDRITLYYHYEPWGPWWERIRDRLELVRVELEPTVSAYDYGDARLDALRYAHHADFVRVEKVLEHGGIYADMDSIFVNPLPARLREHPFVMGEEHPVPDRDGVVHRSLCNAVIISEPGSAFARAWLDRMGAAFNGEWSAHSCRLPAQIADEGAHPIHVEPPRSFFKHMWTREGVRALFTGCDQDNEGVYSFHLWNHLWWAPRAFRETTFNRLLLTEDFIRHVDTTYTVVARRFLPEPTRRRPTARLIGRGALGLIRLADRAVALAKPLNQ